MTLLTAWAAAKRYWPYAVIVALLVAFLWTRADLASQKLKTAQEAAAHEKTVSNYRAAALEREKSDILNVSRVKEETDAISQQTVGSYEQRIAALRADFEHRVRNEAESGRGGSASSPVPTASQSPTAVAQTSCENRLPRRDALIASEQAVQLDELITWAERQAAIDPNGS